METFPTEGFIRAWNEASSIREVAALFGMDVRSASWHAWKLRRNGRVMKNFRDLPPSSKRCADCPREITEPKVRCPAHAAQWLRRHDARFAESEGM